MQIEHITSVFSGGTISSKNYHNARLPPLQEVDLNDAAWNEVVTTRLPTTLQEQAGQLKAWQRKREVRSVSDLLRALLVYACCQSGSVAKIVISAKRRILYPLQKVKRVKGVRIFLQRIHSYRNYMINFAEVTIFCNRTGLSPL